MSKDSIYCALAFHAISWSSEGKASPCCGMRNWVPPNHKYNSPLIERINHDSLKNVRKTLIEGKYPLVCNLCEDQDRNGRISMRTIWNDYYKTHVSNTEYFEEEMDPSKVFAIDINIGNKCNSKCMTCVYTSSDLWQSEAEYIFSTRLKPVGNIMLNDLSMVDQILETFPNLTHITFVGGEPTISDKLDYLLKRLIELDRSKNIELSYTTNLTGITKELMAVWENFKSVGLNVSIDGYGKTNEYIRYPFKWNKIETNLNEYLARVDGKKFGITLGLTTSLFNSNVTHQLLEYWFEKVKDIEHICGIMINKAVDPDYVDMRILSNEYRQKGIPNLEILRNKIPYEERFKPLLSAIDTMISYLNEPEFNNVELKNRARHFIKMSDKFRKRDIRSYCPELFFELYNK
jgi:hypothetical protein